MHLPNLTNLLKLINYFSILFFIFAISINAQSDLKEKLKNKAAEKKENSKQRIDEKIDSTLDASVDAVEEGIGNLFKKKDKTAKETLKEKEKPINTEEKEAADNSSANTQSKDLQSATSLQTYSKFDFVPGETVLFFDDFSQDNIGDFPSLWNTSSKGEVVTMNNYPGKWFKLGMDGVFVPEFKGKLPENFTLEFDTVFDIINSAWSGFLGLDFFNGTNNPVENLENIGAVGFKFKCGTENVTYDSWGSDTDNSGNIQSTFFADNDKQKVRVSVWVQKTRVRLYLNEKKLIDLPKLIAAGTVFDRMRISEIGLSDEANQIYITNYRIAVGAPDMRSKLITEGKLVTRGITFDSGSDKIKPESFGVLKEIATVLKENALVKVKIVGHTDNEGDDKMNMDLSKKRATAVKNSLSKDFAIEAARMETDGKGESQPSGPNTSSEGKANNRRVEFIKL